MSVQLVSKISNVCDPDPPTSQTDGRTDGRTTCNLNTALCTSASRGKDKSGTLNGMFRVHPNKSLLKISEKKQRGRIQGLPNFFGYPQSHARVKLWTSNLASTFTGPSQQKPVKNFGKKDAWAYLGTAPIVWVTPNYLRNG